MAYANDTVADEKVATDIANLRGKIRQYIDVNPEEVEKLLEQVRQHSRKLKGAPMLSKQFLHDLWELIGTLEAEAPGMGAKKTIALRYAGDFQRIMGLILDDKSDLDIPLPGIPRAL
jgi:hypothetical protein